MFRKLILSLLFIINSAAFFNTTANYFQLGTNKRTQASFLTKRMIELQGLAHGVVPEWVAVIGSGVAVPFVITPTDLPTSWLDCVPSLSEFAICMVTGTLTSLFLNLFTPEESAYDAIKLINKIKNSHLSKDLQEDSQAHEQLLLSNLKEDNYLVHAVNELQAMINNLESMKAKCQKVYRYTVDSNIVERFRLFAIFYHITLPVLYRNLDFIKNGCAQEYERQLVNDREDKKVILAQKHLDLGRSLKRLGWFTALLCIFKPAVIVYQ